MFSDVRVPLCRLYLYALSSSGPFVFPGVVVSCSPSLLGWEAGREGLGCGLWLSAQPVGLVNWGNVQEAIGLSPLGEGPAPHVGYQLGRLSCQMHPWPSAPFVTWLQPQLLRGFAPIEQIKSQVISCLTSSFGQAI